MKVVIIGGAGYLGSRAAQALRAISGIEVVIASRRAGNDGGIRLDLGDRATFPALDGADVVVDVANSSIAPPDAVAEYCLEHGMRFLEASSDRIVVKRLHERLGARTGTRGCVILGAGIFTGLSNLLGRAAARLVDPCQSLELGIRSSPLSGSGAGTVALMVDALAIETVSYVAGARVLSPPIRRGPRLPFPSGAEPTLHVPLAEPEMLHASTGAPNVRVFLSPAPNLLQTLFMTLPAFALRSRVFGGFMRIYFNVLRRWVLSSRSTAVEMVAIAYDGKGSRRVVSLRADDGMLAGGYAIAAMAAQLGAQAIGDGAAVRFADDVFDLDTTVARIREMAGETLSIEVRRPDQS